MHYAYIVEKADGNFSAYVPDLPGCVATGPTARDAEKRIQKAIRFHIKGMKADGLELPIPESVAGYAEA